MTTNNIEQLSNAITSLTVEELMQLLKVMSSKLGVDLEKLIYGSGVGVSQGDANVDDSGADSVTPSKKSMFTVMVVSYPSEKKIDIIKKVKSRISHPIALSEVKAMVESLPFKLRESVLLEEKDELVKEFQDLCTLEVVELK